MNSFKNWRTHSFFAALLSLGCSTGFAVTQDFDIVLQTRSNIGFHRKEHLTLKEGHLKYNGLEIQPLSFVLFHQPVQILGSIKKDDGARCSAGVYLHSVRRKGKPSQTETGCLESTWASDLMFTMNRVRTLAKLYGVPRGPASAKAK